MIDFEFSLPTKVVFGRGAENRAGEQVAAFGGTKALVLWGGHRVVASGLIGRVHASLEQAGVAYVDLDGVVPNPRLSHVLDGVALARVEGVDFVLAVGGGSVTDTAKAIGYGLANDFDLADLFLGRVATDRIVPVGCIPTMAAAGSETSNSTVINIDTLGPEMLKRSYNHDCARPKFAIMDPELTYSVPAWQTAAGGADIMMHTMERYFTPTSHVELIDAMSEGLLRTVKEAVPKALANPEDYDARADLLWAGSLSHNGLTGTGRVGDFASHAIEHEMGALFDVTHGAGLCAMWSSWARHVISQDPARFAQFAVNVFGVTNDFHDPLATGLAGIEAWEQWCRSIGMPVTLRELGIDPTSEQVQAMAEGAVTARGGNLGAFMHLDVEDVTAILEAARA